MKPKTGDPVVIHGRKDRRARTIVLLVLVLLLAWVVYALALSAWDPLRRYIGPGGGLELRGRIDSPFLRYLQEGPRPVPVVRSVLVPDGHATGIWRTYSSREFSDVPISTENPRRTAHSSRSMPDVLGVVLGGLRDLGARILSLFLGDAAAACGSGGGTCFWIAGSGAFVQTVHWSASSGGASCTCVPAATDAVIFDANSGAGTASQSSATFTSAAVTMSASSVTVSGTTRTWNVNGNWDDTGFHFSASTSTVVFGATATATGDTWYNLTVSNGFTLSVSSAATVLNVLNVAGTYTATGTAHTSDYVQFGTGSSSPSLTLTGTANFGIRPWASGTFTIPAGTYYYILMSNGGSNHAALSGGVTLSGYYSRSACGTSTFAYADPSGDTLTTNGYALTATYAIEANAGAIVAGASAVTVGGVCVGGGSASFITSTSSGSWVDSGFWTNASTSASWSFAAPITFTGSATTLTAATTLGPEFAGSVTIPVGAGVTLVNALAFTVLRISGTFYVSGFPVTGFYFATNVGYLSLVSWNAYAPLTPSFTWTMSTSVAATLTVILSNVSAVHVALTVAGAVVDTESPAPDGTVTLRNWGLLTSTVLGILVVSQGGGDTGGGGPSTFTCTSTPSGFFTTEITCSALGSLPADSTYSWGISPASGSVGPTVTCSMSTCSWTFSDAQVRDYVFMVHLVTRSSTFSTSTDQTRIYTVSSAPAAAISWGLVALVVLVGLAVIRIGPRLARPRARVKKRVRLPPREP